MEQRREACDRAGGRESSVVRKNMECEMQSPDATTGQQAERFCWERRGASQGGVEEVRDGGF